MTIAAHPQAIAKTAWNLPRIIAGGVIMLLGAYLFYKSYGNRAAEDGGMYCGLAVMIMAVGLSQLFDKTAEAVAIPTLAIIVSLLLFSAFMFFSGHKPLEALSIINEGSFGSAYTFQNTLRGAAPLMLTALCTALPMRVGLVVIGGEGAYIVGALASAGAGYLAINQPMWLMITTMLFAGFVVGGLWIMIVGALKHFRGVNETISSLLMIYIAVALLNHMVEGPWHYTPPDDMPDNVKSTWPLATEDQQMEGGLIKTMDFSAYKELPNPTFTEKMLSYLQFDIVHWGLVYGLLACIISFFLVRYTPVGFAGRVVGGNMKAARLGGISHGGLILLFCGLGGGAAGLAGATQVGAVSYCANANLMQDKFGYTGILVAFLAKHNPLAIIPVAMLIGGIATSDDLLQSRLKTPSATATFLQALIFIVLLASEAWYGKIPFLRAKEAPRG